MECTAGGPIGASRSSPPVVSEKRTTARRLRSSARGRRRQSDERLGVSRLGVTLGAQLGGDLLCAVGEVEARERALEHGQRGLGLVEGDFVACLVDAEEADCGHLLVRVFFTMNHSLG